jgi:hypothetical protein
MSAFNNHKDRIICRVTFLYTTCKRLTHACCAKIYREHQDFTRNVHPEISDL